MHPLSRHILRLIFLFVIGNLYSQPVYFNNRYDLNITGYWDGSDNLIEVDDGYVISGGTGHEMSQDWRVVAFMKIDKLGNKQWSKIIGDTIAQYWNGNSGSLIRTYDNNYAFGGTIEYYNGQSEARAIICKLDTNWDVMWVKEYGDNYGILDTVNSGNQVKQTYDSGFILGGEQYYYSRLITTMLLIKTDMYGNKLWEKTFGTAGFNRGYSVIQTSDSGYAIGGFWYIPGHPIWTGDPIVIKTDNSGNQQWIKNLGGGFLDNKAMICLDHVGNIIVGTNYTYEMSGSDPKSKINIIKLDNQGNIIWNKQYGEIFLNNWLLNIRALVDGNIIAVGESYDPSPEAFSKGWILKVDSNGDSLWLRDYKLLYGNYSFNSLSDIIQTSDLGYLACGDVFPAQPDTGSQDAWVIKLDSVGCPYPECDTTVGIVEIPYAGIEELVIYPNPAAEWLHVTGCRLQVHNRRSANSNRQSANYLCIYDIYGRKVEEVLVPAGQDQVRVDVAGFRNGIYVAVLYSEKQIVGRKKFVVAR